MNNKTEMALDAIKVLQDTFQHSLDRGKQPTFSAGDLRFFIDQLTVIAEVIKDEE